MEEGPTTKPNIPGKPEIASDHNNISVITALSADRDTEKSSSPVTSPLIHRKEVIPNGDSTESDRNPEFRFNQLIAARSKELLGLMNEITQVVGLNDSNLTNFIENQEKGIPNKKFDWGSLVEMSETIFNDYSKEMENITKEFDEVNRVRAYLRFVLLLTSTY